MRIERIVSLCVLAGVFACGGSDSPTGNPGGNNGGNNNCADTSPDIDVSNNRFSPNCVTVAVGTTITWTWSANAGNGHNVTFTAGGPNSPTQTTGIFTRTFPAAGNFAYTCTVHGAAMSGSIRVQ